MPAQRYIPARAGWTPEPRGRTVTEQPVEAEEEQAPSRGRGLLGGFVKILAVLGGILLVLAAIQIVAALLASVVSPVPPGPGPGPRINVQAGDLGAAWRAGEDTVLPGFPSGNSSLRTFLRTATYGGNVTIGSRVAVFPSAGAAVAAFDANVSALPPGAVTSPLAIGDGGLLVHLDNASFPASPGPLDLVLFHEGTVLVNVSVAPRGMWEDLSGQPFTAAYHLQDDLVILARIVASRI